MQPIKILTRYLFRLADDHRYLFKTNDLRALFSSLSDASFKTLLSRAVSANLLTRTCRGIYLFEKMMPRDGLLLFHIALLLRPGSFNYISLETALSDVGVISQIPINTIMIMSSGRSNVIDCGQFGSIEFIHTNQRPKDLVNQLTYDERCGLWRASVAQSLRDMKRTHRNLDLIDWEVADELIRSARDTSSKESA